MSIPTAFQDATRRVRRRAAECTHTYMSSEASTQQSCSLKGEGYKIAVIGVGSPFANDHIAYEVIQLLQQEPSLPASLQYYDRPGWYLLEYMQGFEVVHLIDAIVSDQPIGTLHRYDDIASFQTQNTPLSSHGFGLAETLLLGQALNQLPAQLIIHSIEIAVDNSDVETLKKACLALVERIKGEI